jgi:hypothetical protein
MCMCCHPILVYDDCCSRAITADMLRYCSMASSIHKLQKKNFLGSPPRQMVPHDSCHIHSMYVYDIHTSTSVEVCTVANTRQDVCAKTHVTSHSTWQTTNHANSTIHTSYSQYYSQTCVSTPYEIFVCWDSYAKYSRLSAMQKAKCHSTHSVSHIHTQKREA